MARIVTRNEHARTFRVEAWPATSAHKRVVVFVENRNRREGIETVKRLMLIITCKDVDIFVVV